MNVTGILWTFYPLFCLVAIIEFVMGLAHVFFCLPHFAFALPILCGVVASITAVYALMLHVPNRCELTLQLASMTLAVVLLLSSLTEASCLRRLRSDGGATSICAGVFNRTLASQSRCTAALTDYQNVFFLRVERAKALLIGDDFAPSAAGYGAATIRSVSAARDALATAALDGKRESARIFVASTLALAALVHVCVGVVLTSYSAYFNNFRLSGPHWQVIVGVATLLLSYVYHSYCCVFFYTYVATAVAAYCLIQSAFLVVVLWHFPSRTLRRQMFALAGAALSTALLALSLFGLYCWANRGLASWRFNQDASSAALSDRTAAATGRRRLNATGAAHVVDDGGVDGAIVGVFRYCQKPRRLYLICERSLQFSTPYLYWAPEQVTNEADIVQFVVYTLLSLTALVHFTLFVGDAFFGSGGALQIF